MHETHTAPAIEAVSADPKETPPTQTRYRVLALLVVMAVLMYLDRFALNVAQPVVMKELGISLSQMGLVTSYFFWFYALSQVPAGSLGDRWGARRALTLFVVGWSIVFALQAFATTPGVFKILRVLLGVMQAGAYAVAAGVIRQWIEPNIRGFANSAVSMGGRTGGFLTNLVTPLLMLALVPVMGALGYGSIYEPGRWRETFLLYGAMGVMWGWIFWRWFRDLPQDHPQVNAAELAMIERGRDEKPAAAAAGPIPPWWIVLGNRNLYLLSGAMFFVNVGWIFLLTSQVTYLEQAFGSSLVQAGSLTALTTVGGMVGCLAGGFATDYLLRRMGIVWGRRIPGMIASGGAALMYLLAMMADSLAVVVLAFGCVSFLNDFLLGGLWSTVQDVGRRNSGAMFGFINMSGNLGAAAFPPILGWLVETTSWNVVFVVAAAAYLVSFVLWAFVDPRLKLPEQYGAA